jgi:hypothetical protein
MIMNVGADQHDDDDDPARTTTELAQRIIVTTAKVMHALSGHVYAVVADLLENGLHARLPEINISAVAYRAMWGYGVGPPSDTGLRT